MNNLVTASDLLIDSFYLPPVAQLAYWSRFSSLWIDAEKYFMKSGWQNRCSIVAANGPLLLSIPVQGGRNIKKTMKDVRISYEERWQQNHWNSICSAYNRSAFFEFYEHHFKPFYFNRYESLLELNLALVQAIFKALNMSVHIKIASPVQGDGMLDLQNTRSSMIISANSRPYYQVFQHKHGFIPGMSVIDLIFNEGPGAVSYLEKWMPADSLQ